MAHCPSCQEAAPGCLCNTCLRDDDGFCCIITHDTGTGCPVEHCEDYEKEA